MTTFANGESGLSVRTKINNVLQHTDGTAGELVINEAGADVDFRVESDTLANALLVDGATGNVGIGANSPYTKLDIVQATAGHGGWKYGASLNATDFPALRFLATTGNTGSIIAHEAGATVFLTGTTATGAGTERMRIDSSGNVGIGTSSPDTNLSVRNATGTAGLRLSGIASTLGARLLLENTALTQFSAGRNYNDIDFITASGGSESAGGFARIRAGHQESGSNATFISISTAPNAGSLAERLRIDASGNLLIGTTTSGASKLRISGLPTSSAGLSAGDVWNDAGTLKIA